MPRSYMFFVGAFGGVTPSLLRLALDLVAQRQTLERLGLSYFVGIALFAFLGAGLAVVWNEGDPKKVFYIGLGLPSLLTVVTTNVSPSNPLRIQAQSIYSRPVLAANEPAPNRYLKLEFPQEAGVVYAAFTIDGPKQLVFPVRAEISFIIPDTATSVVFTSDEAASSPVPLPASAGAEIFMKLRLEKVSWYGFQYALGVQTKPYLLVLDSAPKISEATYILKLETIDIINDGLNGIKSWDFIVWLNDKSICELNGWRQVLPRTKSIDLKTLGHSCAPIPLPAGLPVRIWAQGDSNPTNAKIVGTFELERPREATISIRVRNPSSTNGIFVVNGKITPR